MDAEVLSKSSTKVSTSTKALPCDIEFFFYHVFRNVSGVGLASSSRREPYCPLSSAVCNATIPTSAFVYIGFISRMRDWTVTVACSIVQ
jgi:hypothetical protein